MDVTLDQDVLAGLLGGIPAGLSQAERELLAHYNWLSFEEITWMLALAHAGTDGLTGAQARAMVKSHEIGWLRLEACGIARWERDLRGRLAYLVLTPKGIDFSEALVKASRQENKLRRP